MIQRCSFIAHYNQAGFYGTYFEDPKDTIKFLKQFDNDLGCKSIEYGMDYCLMSGGCGDINTAMVDTLKSYKAEMYLRLRQKAKDKKMGEIERLKTEIEGSVFSRKK